jgi:uncharacterized protein (TIGR01777 family)
MKILIAGGSGLVGTHLIKSLKSQGHSINLLSTRLSAGKIQKEPRFLWNTSDLTIDEACIEGVDCVINLAGYPVAKRWTRENIKLIRDSRINSSRMLVDLINKTETVSCYIGSSAIGYYADSNEMYDESGPKGTGFMADLVDEWEQASVELRPEVRSLIFRISVVLANEGGAYAKVKDLFKKGLGSIPGPGGEYLAWVHIDDLCAMIVRSISDEQMNGVYNAVSSQRVKSTEFYKSLAESFGKRIWLPNVPIWILKLAMGSSVGEIVASHNLSNEKIKSTGFEFQFETLESAFAQLRKQKKGHPASSG